MVHTPLTPVESQRQIDLCKYKASLAYIVSSRLARATQRDSVSKKKKRYYMAAGVVSVVESADYSCREPSFDS